jgi:hypothetical protein
LASRSIALELDSAQTRGKPPCGLKWPSESIAIARSYDGIVDMLLLDSHRPGDVQIGGSG